MSTGVNVSLAELINLRHAARKLQLARTKRTMASHSGDIISCFRGRGIDFDEVRAYQPGDDIRTMDWRVTARTGTAHTKIYREEREHNLFIVTDFSHSMFFGTKVAFKSVIAAKVASLLAWAGVAQGDRVGGIVFADDQLTQCRPRSRAQSALHLLHTLTKYSQSPAPTTDPDGLAKALQRLDLLARPASTVFIISDFNTLNPALEQALNQLYLHQQVIAIQIIDPLEIEPPAADRYLVSNGANLAALDTRNKAFCQAYRDHFAKQQQNLQQQLRKLRIPLWSIVTNDDITEKLRIHLRELRHG